MPKKEENPFSMKYELDAAAGTVKAILRERNDADEFVEVASEVYKYDSLPEGITAMVKLYGLSKVLQDRCSEVEVGSEKIPALSEVFAQLSTGQWEKARVVGGTVVSAEVEALAQLKGISIPDAQKALSKYDKAQKEKILANAQVVALAKSIREARANKEATSLDDLAA